MVFLAINISTAENGVILNPSTIQLVIPHSSQAKEIRQYPNILFLIRRASVNVKNIIEQLYKNTHGSDTMYFIVSTKECLPSISRIISNTIAITIH
jgi:hypothetical protein